MKYIQPEEANKLRCPFNLSNTCVSTKCIAWEEEPKYMMAQEEDTPQPGRCALVHQPVNYQWRCTG